MKKNTFLQDFQAFVNRGNVVDMAVGVIVGGAFSKIASSLVNDVIMPLLSLILGKANFTELVITLREATVDEAGEVVNAAVTLNYGSFIQYIFDFLLVALAIFVVIRMMGKLRARFERKEEIKEEKPAVEEPVVEEPAAEEAPAPEPTKEELLLEEIRDILIKK
ncbi:MAG TPA: large conductance mechanosensitive channel protein MscL [Clostridiales bacterium]|nr:large conductance mechanosensitive channel protein MscL [Clostridiales bacterium]